MEIIVSISEEKHSCKSIPPLAAFYSDFSAHLEDGLYNFCHYSHNCTTSTCKELRKTMCCFSILILALLLEFICSMFSLFLLHMVFCIASKKEKLVLE